MKFCIMNKGYVLMVYYSKNEPDNARDLRIPRAAAGT